MSDTQQGRKLVVVAQLCLRADRQSARMSKIINDGLTRYGTGCFIVVLIWQQLTSNG